MSDSDVTPANPPKKKGLHPAAWVAIGCGGVLLLTSVALGVAGIFVFNKVKDVAAEFGENPAMGAAALLVRMNPELELVERDDRNQTLTIMSRETGEQATFDLEEVQQGRLSFRTPEGQIDLQIVGGEPADIPSWIPVYPGANVQGGWAASSDGDRAGGFSVSAGDGAGVNLFEFYRSRLEDAGFTTQMQMTSERGMAGTLIAVSPDERRGVSVVVTGPQAVVNYTIKP